jgi:uncharacterized protein (TIGR01777 family)
MKIAIAGASGMVGKALTKSLTGKGHTVTALKRGNSADQVFVNVSPEYLEGFDAVINLAGENIAAKRWSDEQKKLIVDSRVSTTSFLANALSKTKGSPKVFINASAIGIYGNRGSEAITEESSPGAGFLASTCKQWEEAAKPAKRDGLRVVIARLGVVLSKEGGALNKMLLPFQLGAGGVLGSGRQYMSWIEINDLVKAFEFLLENNVEGVVNMTSPNPATNAEFTSAMAKVLSRPAILPAPAFGLKLILGEMAQEMLLEGSLVLPTKLEKAGFKFDYANLEKALNHELKATAGSVA